MTNTKLDRDLEAAQAALIAHYAPETSVRRARWSQGETQVLELGTGSPLMLIHGGLSACEWVPILPVFARHHRVLIVDRPGHGLAEAFDYRGVDMLKHAFGKPEEGEAIAAGNANLRVVRIPRAGHLPWIDEPERVVAELESFVRK